MPAPFPPWSDGALRFAILVGALAVFALPLTLMAWVRSPLATGQGRTPQQPVQFDHRHHTQDNGIDCLYCHYEARTGPLAGVPETSLCMGCHAQIRTDAPQVAPLIGSMNHQSPIVWNRVHDLPDFVFFHHAAHVGIGVGCETCHGRVDQMASVAQFAPLTMGWCLDCHRDPEPHLRPVQLVTRMGYSRAQKAPHAAATAARTVSPPLHCSGCHR